MTDIGCRRSATLQVDMQDVFVDKRAEFTALTKMVFLNNNLLQYYNLEYRIVDIHSFDGLSSIIWYEWMKSSNQTIVYDVAYVDSSLRLMISGKPISAECMISINKIWKKLKDDADFLNRKLEKRTDGQEKNC